MLTRTLEQPIVDFLRAEGHDVLSASDAFASAPDPEVLNRGNAQDRILITNDLDFGELVFRQKRQTAGILLLRFKVTSLAEKISLFQKQWPLAQRELPGAFVVMTRRAIRVRPLNS